MVAWDSGDAPPISSWIILALESRNIRHVIQSMILNVWSCLLCVFRCDLTMLSDCNDRILFRAYTPSKNVILSDLSHRCRSKSVRLLSNQCSISSRSYLISEESDTWGRHQTVCYFIKYDLNLWGLQICGCVSALMSSKERNLSSDFNLSNHMNLTVLL